ncbi:MAG: hypothetical protein ACTSYO_08200 [Candidatus Ranarchaeia archaeon]
MKKANSKPVVVESNTSKSDELKEFDVEIRISVYGYVRVRAKNPIEAKNGVEKANRKKLMNFYKEKCKFITICEAQLAERKKMVLDKCELDDEISQIAVFEVIGSHDNKDFHCRIGINLDPDEINLNQIECDWLEGILDSDGLEELLSEIIETEEYQAAADELQKQGNDLDSCSE